VAARLLASLLCLWLGIAPASASERIGVVLLHGKTGTPAAFTTLAGTLDETGYPVETPEMCWSARRIYDRPFDDCLADVDAAVARLEADGFDHIVIGGHSLGGLAALAYGATHPGLAGILALAPDGEPAEFNRHRAVAASVKKARVLVKAGKGDTASVFTDRVLGHDFKVRATPRAFLSFLGDDSPLLLARSLPNLRAPLLWVVGARDSSQRNAAAAFKRAPANRLSRFVTVDAGHLGTPDAASTAILDWLDRLAAE